jgi:hypothetical protein
MSQHPRIQDSPPGFGLPPSLPDDDAGAWDSVPLRFPPGVSACRWCGIGVRREATECAFCAAERHGVRLHGRIDLAAAVGLSSPRLRTVSPGGYRAARDFLGDE